jgi:hypothetical protein
MRFPLRLAADLTLGLTARSLRLRRNRPLLLNLVAGGNADDSKSPIVWMGGPEPLELPETPRVVNSLAAAGSHVFLPTTGMLLRRRIHEFQPTPHLHLTICFDGTEASHDGRAGRQGAFRDALEGLRTARLSGFLLCAQLILHSASEVAELERLYAELRKLDLDGFLISASEGAGKDLISGVAALRRRLLTRRWALLSTLLDSVQSSPGARIAHAPHASSRHGRGHAGQMPSRSCEQSVQAP